MLVLSKKFLEEILKNFKSGIIVASPSKFDPDYYYHWTRDAGLTILLFIRLLKNNNFSEYHYLLKYLIEQYIDNELNIIKKLNINDLGEPKFYINGDKYDKQWGRPQNDGPAIRSYVLAEYALEYIDKNKQKELVSKLWNNNEGGIINRDLEYLLNNTIYQPSFDLWEEVCGDHYFTTYFQVESLKKIYQLLLIIDNNHSLLSKIKITKFQYYKKLLNFYDEKNKVIKSSCNIINMPYDLRCWNDISTILCKIYCMDNPICYYTLNTLYQLVEKFKWKYSNTKLDFVPIGRYYEDSYYDGLPWFLTTIGFIHYLKLCFLNIEKMDDETFNKFIQIMDLLDIKHNGHKKDITLITNINKYFNKVESFISKFYSTHSQLSEQYCFKDLNPKSAYHLTWSYASFILYSLE